jgi:enamine deaminase RidA (YjgF/YER057c/UK114 family)
MKRVNISSGAKWEDIVGYSRAVRLGNVVEVAGTTAVIDGKIVGINEAYAQTKAVLQKIETALKQAGATMENVVRTRMFVTDIGRWEEYARAHSEFFKNIKPTTSIVEVKALMDPEMLIEIEATAILDSE